MSHVPQFGTRRPGVGYQLRLAAYAVILNPAGQVALVGDKGHLFLPGGGSHPDESPEETITREILEECGRRFAIERRLGEAVQFFEADSVHFEMRAHLAQGRFTSAVVSPPEHKLVWLPLSEARDQLFHDCHVWAIQQALVQHGPSQ